MEKYIDRSESNIRVTILSESQASAAYLVQCVGGVGVCVWRGAGGRNASVTRNLCELCEGSFAKDCHVRHRRYPHHPPIRHALVGFQAKLDRKGYTFFFTPSWHCAN